MNFEYGKIPHNHLPLNTKPSVDLFRKMALNHPLIQAMIVVAESNKYTEQETILYVALGLTDLTDYLLDHNKKLHALLTERS